MQLGKINNLGLQRRQLRHRQAHQTAGKKQILAPRELRMKPCAQLQNRRHTAPHLHLPCRRLQRPGQQLEQGTLASAIVPNHPQALTALQRQRHILQRPMALVQSLPCQHRPQPLARGRVQPILLAHPL